MTGPRQLGTRSSLWRVVLTTVLSIAVVLVLVATIRPLRLGGGDESFTALFTSASRIRPGAPVMIGGVRVGRVQDVSLDRDATARVSFQVDDDVPVTVRTRAAIRYLDLVGGRYLALTDPAADARADAAPAAAQKPGQAIPTSRTEPALDLNALLNGFKPLFSALNPKDVNALAQDIIRTFQGEGMTVRELIARTGSLTSGLAERDQLIGSLIDNLGTTVSTVAKRHDQLEQLIDDVASFSVGLASDRRSIGAALQHLEVMTALSADLLHEARPSLREDIAQLRLVARLLGTGKGRGEVEHALDHLPRKLERLARTASYGSWFNYYVCSVKFRLDSGTPVAPEVRELLNRITLNDSAKRCDP
jgi:phospholipid/cholesterol/gamma-HCH transport system substrate-binding protein